ncbi:hypothetical protein HU200_015625 [Digitaria exilis]|uniref:Uncharacterized protein n=1 Tax=Digitaria exilis TaxID=1010633 RepID=A0A835KIL1_9POAL|nr:hypothetical protein HU200_015625 [Digitaria exilis]
MAQTLNRAQELGAMDLAPTFQMSKSPPPPFFLPLLSFFPLFYSVRTLPGAAIGAPFEAAGPLPVPTPTAAALLQRARPHCECGKPARAFLYDQLCEVPSVDPSST